MMAGTRRLLKIKTLRETYFKVYFQKQRLERGKVSGDRKERD